MKSKLFVHQCNRSPVSENITARLQWGEYSDSGSMRSRTPLPWYLLTLRASHWHAQCRILCGPKARAWKLVWFYDLELIEIDHWAYSAKVVSWDACTGSEIDSTDSIWTDLQWNQLQQWILEKTWRYEIPLQASSKSMKCIHYVPREKQTLFGAIPALTVSLVSSKTIRRISCTQSAAETECSSQCNVILDNVWWSCSKFPLREKKLTWDILHHIQQSAYLDRNVWIYS